MEQQTTLTEKYVRKPFYVDGVQVTETNMLEVAKWCLGIIDHSNPGTGAPDGNDGPRPYIRVAVIRPLHERQTQAFAGDWIVKAGSGFKVYTDTAFRRSFEPVIAVLQAS